MKNRKEFAPYCYCFDLLSTEDSRNNDSRFEIKCVNFCFLVTQWSALKTFYQCKKYVYRIIPIKRLCPYKRPPIFVSIIPQLALHKRPPLHLRLGLLALVDPPIMLSTEDTIEN